MNTAKDERIERYLRNTMSESEKSAFQFELMQDEGLRSEVKAMRRLQKTLIAESRMPSGQNGTYKWWWFLPLLLLPLGYFLLTDTQENIPLPVTPKTEKTPPVEPTNNTKEEETKKKEEAEKPTKEESTKEVIEKYQPVEKEKKPEIKQPIALAEPADLVPNPLFEQMTTGVRGNEMTLTVKSPTKNTVIKWQQNLSIAFAGDIETEAEEKPVLNLLIFSNKKEDFEDWNYLVQTSAKIDKTGNGFTYFVQPTLSVKRGLYYYILENEETEEPVLTGKFEIK